VDSQAALLRVDDRVAGPQVERIRVTHLVYRLQEGGMEHGVLKIVNGLRGDAIESSICSTVPATSLKDRVGPNVALVEFQRRRGNDPAFVWQLYRFLKRHRPHILHTHSWGTLCEGLVAARLAGVPIVVHGEHGTLQTKKLQLLIQHWAWQRMDRLLAVSSRLADRMAETVAVPRDRIRVIRNGVDLERFRARRNEARIGLALSADALVLGTVGRLVDVKDHVTLLEAMGVLASDGVPFIGVIAGDGPLRPALESKISALGLQDRVRLLGYRYDIDNILAALDIFALSSRSEGLSNTILEAMACGLPVVATHVGGAEELVEHGRTGLLVPAQSVGALSQAIGVLARDPECRTRMGSAGRKRAEQEFSLSVMVNGYRQLYLEVARESRILPESRLTFLQTSST
jgi:L-malate glycosyltransferase